MDGRVFDDRRRIGTVRAAVNMYGERILESSSSSLKKPAQMDLPEKSSSRAKDLRFAERDLVRYKESRMAAESAEGKAESRLSEAKRKVKNLALQIEQSNLKVKAKMRDMDMLINMLKENADREAIRKKIDEANEEQMPVELTRIEALKEFGEIQAQRENEASEFSPAMVENKKKMKNAKEEDSSSKDLESKLAVTLYDANLLRNELKLGKNMDKKGRNDSMKHLGDSFRKGKQLEDSPALKSTTEELHAAKKELASIREGGFQSMTSMDIIRNELRQLLRAKSKLETACAVEEKAKSILSSLSVTLEQLKTETELARKEKKLISEETANIKSEIHKTESQMDLTEGKLQAAIRELQAVKTSESLALENLRNVIENTMRSRASASQHTKAEEIADKKVAAAHAWIEALKASEKEILMKIELAHRDIRETRNTEAENQQQPSPRKSMEANGNQTPSRRSKLRNSGSPAVRMTPRSTSITIKKKGTVEPNLAKFFIGKS
ncbi:hypothetical protein POTOM_017273 [Populus tomentosa]|uniref:WEB family protein n=1 Tax=Populus tomentosa TaxID=118781 RepID=A0A8X7ZX79_POPTO|nr:hypothetical protein POTOM_017273 [Populus tomentosa]